MPGELGACLRLEELWLHANKLQGELPEALFRGGSALKHCYLFRNRLAGDVPASVGHLKQLQKLYLQDNRLRSVPPAICGCAELRALDLHANRMSRALATAEFAEGLRPLRKLRTLDVRGNRVNEEKLPAALARLREALPKCDVLMK